MRKRALLSVAVLLACTSATAAEYFIVVPVKNRKAPDTIAVALASLSLPVGKVGSAYAGVNFPTLLQVTGDPDFTGAGVRWTISQGGLPAGLALDATSGRLTGTPSSATPSTGQAFQVMATYKTKQGTQTYNLVVAAREPHSCREYLASNPSVPSGWYELDADGDGPAPKQSYYCDMTSDGGGWTRIVRQTEANPVTNWNGGVNGGSYALDTAAIPAHTQVGFGRDEVATAVDYVNWSYSTGNIPVTTVTSPKTGISYQVNRDDANHFTDHDPESSAANIATPWSNSLTFDRVGGVFYTWAFSPMLDDAGITRRGYALNGAHYYDADSFAWTVWVR